MCQTCIALLVPLLLVPLHWAIILLLAPVQVVYGFLLKASNLEAWPHAPCYLITEKNPHGTTSISDLNLAGGFHLDVLCQHYDALLEHVLCQHYDALEHTMIEFSSKY